MIINELEKVLESDGDQRNIEDSVFLSSFRRIQILHSAWLNIVRDDVCCLVYFFEHSEEYLDKISTG